DNFTRPLVGNKIECHALADGIIVGEESPRERLIDDDNQRTGCGVLSSDIPATQDRNLHRREVIGRDRKIVGRLTRLLRVAARCGAWGGGGGGAVETLDPMFAG